MSLLRTLVLCAATVAGTFSTTGQTQSSSRGDSTPPPRLKAAGQTFAIIPTVGMPSAHTRTGQMINRVWGDLKSTVILLEDGDRRMVFMTSALSVEWDPNQSACRAVIAEALHIPPESVVINSAHNHSVPKLEIDQPGQPPKPVGDKRSKALGDEFLAKLREAALSLPAKLEPVVVKYGVGHEDRVTYNRRGYREGGTTYFIRDEDRVLLPPNYKGLIDTDATVVLFEGKKGPVACLARYTGHPVTSYKPEDPTTYGDWPQVACEKLSAHLGGIPVGFVQGCCGDINSKYMFSGTLEQSKELGGYLGDSFIEATKILRTSKRDGFQLRRQVVDVPYAPLPPRADIERDLASIDDFIKRANAGDENTLYCVGMNFPKALTPKYRATLIDGVRPWYVWALEQYDQGKANQVAKAMPLEIVVARFGDVGFAGMPAETFVRTGFKIKYGADLPCVLASGYTGVIYGYIPDATACDDREYMGGFFRYRQNVPPYQAPGADAMADAAIVILNDFAKISQK